MSPLIPMVGLLAAAFICMAARELALAGKMAGKPEAERSGSSDGGSRDSRSRRNVQETPAAAISLGLPERIRRAGRSGDLSPRSLLMIKAGTALLAVAFVSLISPVIPAKVVPVFIPVSVAAGFFLPDLMLERAARRRHRTMIAALPDALDLLAVSVATGKSLGAGLLDLLEAGRGPLSRELAETGEDMAWGASQSEALEGLRLRVGGKEIAALCATLERSRKLGSPLADQLRGQSTGLRRDQKRAIEEKAARAAPKIQLVIALVLVPSVLLMIAASLIANSQALIGGL